jgi:tetratricopeptide (TPR) repeat protein
VATQRCSQGVVFGLVLLAAVIGGGLAGCSRTPVANDSQATTAPSQALRQPRWLESYRDRTAKRAQPVTEPPAPEAAPVAPPAPATLAADPQAAAVETSISDPSIELAIPDTPPASADGKPGRALVRSRDTSAVDAFALLTAGWTDLAPGESAGPKPDEAVEESSLKPQERLGPESSVLNPEQKAEGDPPSEPAAPVQESAEPEQIVDAKPQPEPAPIASWAKQADEPESTEPPSVTTETAPAELQPPAATDITAADEPAPMPSGAEQSPAAPVAEPPDQTPTLSIDPASFQGVFPGKTTRDEVEASWGKGEPFARDDGTTGLFWKVEPFERVEVILDGEAVGSIMIKLAEPMSVRELATQLEIADIRTVSVLDEQGISIGEVFPERGVIFSVNPGTQSAQAVILEPLDPESFVLRAERELEINTALATADLQYAIEIDPEHLRALRLLLALRCEQGRWTEALTLAERAEAVDPDDIWTRLKHASALTALEQTAAALEKVEGVRQQPNTSPLVVAQAERMLGRIQLGSAEPDYQKAVEHFSNAIKTASTLVNAKAESAQKAARDVLLDAHLGTALAIAKGTWQQKARVIPKWITRSETIVNEAPVDKELEQHALELQLCRGALAVTAASTESCDPLPWVKRLLQVRAKLDGTTTDPWRRRQIDWEIGEGLSDALVATQKRGDAADMLDNATLTAAYLERGAELRQLTPTERKNLGDLLFRIGILHSLQKGDHAAAVTWFDKVLPLWEGNPAFAHDGATGQLGESLVSMAITYWQVNRRDDAVAINRKGIDLMMEAVEQQTLNEQSLAVAYGNLSTMYAEQGDDEQARNYAELATRAEATGTVRK